MKKNSPKDRRKTTLATVKKVIETPSAITSIKAVEEKKVAPYSKLRTLGFFTVSVYSLYIFILLIAVYFDISQIKLIQTIITGGYVSDSQVNANDQTQSWIGLLQSNYFFLTVIVFLVWYKRAYRNLSALKKPQSTTPNWAVLDFFIPIICFFEPYKRVKEIWRACFEQHGQTFVFVWWVLHLGAFVLWRITQLQAVETSSEILNYTFLVSINDIYEIGLAGLTIFLILKISKQQDFLSEGNDHN